MALIPDKDKPTIPRQKLEDYNILCFSEPGLGKTSFANAFNDSFLLLFENSAKALMSNDLNLTQKVEESKKYKYEWGMFRDTISEFIRGGHGYQTIAVDTITRAYEDAMEYIKQEKLDGIHPAVLMNDDDHSGYSLLNEELERQFSKILNSDYGTILTAHAEFKKVADLKGTKRHKLVPDTGGSFGRWIMGEVDITIFLDKNNEGDRILKLEASKDFSAKQRLNFEQDEILVETDKSNPGEHMYKKFKKEFDKAIQKKNEDLGITEEMIEEHYQETEKEREQRKERKELLSKVKEIAQSKGLSGAKTSTLARKQVGKDNLGKLNIQEIKQFLEFLKDYEE